MKDDSKVHDDQSSALPIVGTPMKNASIDTVAMSEDMEVPKDLLNSLLPPQNTPGEFMHDPKSPFDTCSDTQGYSHQDKDSPIRSYDGQISNPPLQMLNQMSEHINISPLNDSEQKT